MIKNKTFISVFSLLLLTALFFSCATDPAGGNGDSGNTDGGNTTPAKYSLTVDRAIDGNGTGSIDAASTANGSYDSGTSITVTAVTDAGSFFFGWYDAADGGKIVSREATYSFSLAANTRLFARFDSELITFPDPILQQAIREVIPKSTGDITYADVKGITELSHNGYDSVIKNLSGIEYLTSLSNLNLYYNKIADIGALANLTNLTTLNLRANQITDITPLNRLTGLTRLDLEGNQITDITPLSRLTNINYLNLNGNFLITDFSPLANLVMITELGLSHLKLADLQPLAKLKNLTNLNLAYNQINDRPMDIRPLTNLTKLEILNLVSNRLTDIEPLTQIASLTILHLNGNAISDLKPLSGLVNLTMLSLENNRITDLKPLTNLINLASLSVGNYASSPTPDSNYNLITDLTPLRYMKELTILSLSHNQITDIRTIANLTKLTHLDLKNNGISDITPLTNLTKIETLFLNNETHTQGPYQTTNRITDITALINNTGLGAGSTVYIKEGNTIDAADIALLEAKSVTVW